MLLGLSKTENDKDQKKSKPAINRPSEKFINDDKDKEEMKIAGKESKKNKKVKNKKKKERKNEGKKKSKHNKKDKKTKSMAKNTMAKFGRPKELIPEDIKIVKKMEKITAEDLPGAYGDDPTIGMMGYHRSVLLDKNLLK